MVVVVAAAALLWVNRSVFLTKASRATSVKAQVPSGRFPDGTEVYMKSNPQQKSALIQLVRHYCKKEFHRESCVGYVIKCGRPCLADLNQEEIEKLRIGYHEMRAEKGLPNLNLGGR